VDSTFHSPADHPPPAGQAGPHQTRLDVTLESTLAAHRRLQALGLNVVSLNFANAVVPGGGFLHGARAQEEYLCRSSALYHSINGSPMYTHNRAQATCLYSDAMIYSPDVPVFRDDDHKLLPSPPLASFITSPAPLATRLTPDERRQLRPVFTRRIHKVLSVAQDNGHDGLVLGAWG
ncbi:MAG: TIGR02452 family protein, partial [Bacteroidota bacterium]